MAQRFLFQNPGNRYGREGPGSSSGGGGAGRQETATLLRGHQGGRGGGMLSEGVKDGV